MSWFAGAQVAGLIKLILQGLEGKISPFFSSLAANELYLIAILMQWMGLYWFVIRKPMRSTWQWFVIALSLVLYSCLFPFKVPYIANLINLPFVVICASSAWMLWKCAKEPFKGIARIAAGVALLQMVVAGYRAILTNLRYIHPMETVNAHADSSWLYSLAAAAFLSACMSMCVLWFLFTELQRELAVQARTDPLTGALNRRSMEEAAVRETARSLRSGCALSMIVLDIDNFKHLNDTRGHAAGDCALETLVCRIKATLRHQDLLARTGGEEFAILLPDTAEPAAMAIAERVREVIADMEIHFETEPIKMTICAGVAQLDTTAGWEAMMRNADTAMYEAKRHGRNRVTSISPRCLKLEAAAAIQKVKPAQVA